MKANLVRNTKTSQFYIEVHFPNKGEDHLFDGIVEHCAGNLSVNELKIVYAECNKQLLAMNPDDIPLRFKEMLKELQQTIINRHAYAEKGGG